MEHYPDAVRFERRQMLTLQNMIIKGQGLSDVDWGWLDDIESERWGGQQEMKPPSQRELMARILAGQKVGGN